MSAPQRLCLVAGAGAGKTYRLVEHYQGLLDAGLEPGLIVAITFTEKAAGEMRQRIGEKISPELAAKLAWAPINTIHGFCASLLRDYGLVLGLTRNEIREALRFCREAVSLESYNPDLRCNLGRVLLRAGRRREAYQSFQRGLRLQADHPGLVRAVRRLGIRRRPVLPFLSRSNLINVFLGRIRAPRGRAQRPALARR